METGAAVREISGLRVRGWRAWAVTETPAGLRLASPLYDAIWLPGATASAVCRRDEDPFAERVASHAAPGVECACGFHAARDPVDALSYLRGRDEPSTLCRVLGEVALSGLVVETEAGWRASEAYPAQLYVADPAVAEELSVYRVPVMCPVCKSASATSSRAASAGSWTSSPRAARMRWSRANTFG